MPASSREVEWGRLPAAEIRRRAEADAIVVIPIGATEQHGREPGRLSLAPAWQSLAERRYRRSKGERLLEAAAKALSRRRGALVGSDLNHPP